MLFSYNFHFFISVLTLPLLHMWNHISNVHVIEINIVYIEVTFYNITKTLYVLVNESVQFRITCSLGYYVPNILNFFSDAVHMCTSIDWFFATIINANNTIFYIYRFFVPLIIHTRSIFLALITMRNQSIFLFVHFTIARMRLIGTFRFDVVPDLIDSLTCF